MTAARWLASFVAGYVVTSGLNWFTAEKLLNPRIKPALGPLMRDGGSTQVGVLVGGFALIVLVLAILLALVPQPRHWAVRGLLVGGLLSLAAFFGTYTFLSGWTTLPTGAMCLTAIADSVTVMAGAVVIAAIQDFGRIVAPGRTA